MIEVENKEEFLNEPIGNVLWTITQILDEEDLESGTMIISLVDESEEGFLFKINCERIEKKKGFWSRLFQG